MNNVKRSYKRKKIWTVKEEELLIGIWEDRIYQLRGNRRNRPVMEDMKRELAKYDCLLSVIEIKNKVHNLTTKYVKEKSLFKQSGVPSSWSLYSKVNNILGRFHNNVVEEIIDSDDDDCSYGNDISKSSQISSIKSSSKVHPNNCSPEEFVICRTCIGECTNYKSLYRFGLIKGEKTTLAAMLSFCTGLKFSEQESTSLTSFICTNCIQELTKSYLFKKKVLEAEKSFRTQLNSTKSIENDIDQEQCEVKIENAPNFIETVIKTELPSDHHKADDYLEYILRDDIESTAIDNATAITKEKSITNRDDIATKVEQRYIYINKESDIRALDIEFQTIEKRDKEKSQIISVNPLEVTLKSKPNAIHFIICKICGKQFRNKNFFRCHMQLHSNTHLKCNVFSKELKTDNANDAHKSTHVPSVCKICGKSYQYSSSLIAHMKIHTSELETFTCNVCGKNFYQKWNYKTHMLIHTGEQRLRAKPYSCDICGKSFYTYKIMWSHRGNHGGLRKYKCTKCFQRYSKAEQLESHMLVHTKETAFICHICGQAFKRQSSLLIHLRFHGETIIS